MEAKKRRKAKSKESETEWVDVPERIFKAFFDMLVEFVEKEKPFKYHHSKRYRTPTYQQAMACLGYSRGHDTATISQANHRVIEGMHAQLKRQARVGAEIWRLYVWYKNRPNVLKQIASLMKGMRLEFEEDGCTVKVCTNKQHLAGMALSRKLDKQDDDNFVALAKIRGSLWT